MKAKKAAHPVCEALIRKADRPNCIGQRLAVKRQTRQKRDQLVVAENDYVREREGDRKNARKVSACSGSDERRKSF